MNKKNDGGEIFAGIEKAVEKLFVASGRAAITAATLLLMGAGRAKGEHILYGQCTGLSLPFVFMLTYRRHYLDFLEWAFPWALTPERAAALGGYPFFVHFGAVFLALHVFALVLLGIAPYRQKNAFQRAVDSLGLSSGTGEKPRVVSVRDCGGLKKTAIIRSFGVGPERYRAKADDLQSATGWVVGKIARNKTNPTVVEIHLTEKELPDKVEYEEVAENISQPYRFPVGVSLAGPVSADLDELPHLLIAGVTGSGKSTFLNSLLTALLANSPRLTVYGIDLKIVELSPYKKFPKFSVDTTMGDALRTLKKVKREMDRRYGKVLGPKGLRKIDPERDKLDRIAVVVDECSDLYGKPDRSSGDYKATSECRRVTDELARKGRAAGIHLILATQRVSAQTLDSRILANIGAKVCFRMTSVANSVLVLNSKAAFDLPNIPGRAYWSLGTTLEEVQAPYIDKETTEREAELASYEYSRRKEEEEKKAPFPVEDESVKEERFGE